MKKVSYVLITFVSVFALMLSSVDARGRGGGGGGHGGGHFGGGGASLYRGGGGYGGYGGYGGAYRSFGGTGAVGGFGGNAGVYRGSGGTSRGGGYSKPSVSGQRQFRGQTGQGNPSRGQVQNFLGMKNSAARTSTGMGKVGAAAVGATAGAMALNHFSRSGSVAGLNSAVGHTPVQGTSFSNRINPQTTQQLRNNYSQRYGNAFNRNWWGNHRYINNYWGGYGGWGGYGWGYWWGPATWLGLSSWIPWGWGSPLYYDYGSNFYYNNGFVYLNGQRLCSAPQYYDQAVQIIDKAPEVTNNKDQWMPLGVFAVTQDASKPSDMVLQLAVNKEGVIRGTYFNSKDNKAKPIKGMVDKESERAVWTFADKNKNAVIMETGIYNLTKDETGVLVHFGKEQTQEWLMVRLNEPPEKGKQAEPTTTTQ